jgi:hypothetical protein
MASGASSVLLRLPAPEWTIKLDSNDPLRAVKRAAGIR